VALVVAAVVGAELMALTLKAVIGRPRPYVRFPEQEPLLHATLDLSLPSGHAATSFAAATVLARLVPRIAVPAFLLAAAVALSRVYVGVHYPVDVALGAFLGFSVGAAVTLAAPRLVAARALPRPRAGRRRSPPEPPRD
jgi:undecaprenyl-diphosphatase